MLLFPTYGRWVLHIRTLVLTGKRADFWKFPILIQVGVFPFHPYIYQISSLGLRDEIHIEQSPNGVSNQFLHIHEDFQEPLKVKKSRSMEEMKIEVQPSKIRGSFLDLNLFLSINMNLNLSFYLLSFMMNQILRTKVILRLNYDI